MQYIAPCWLPGGHAQTIWPVRGARLGGVQRPVYRRERWDTPDGDFVDVDWAGAPAQPVLLVHFHGLEGSSGSHYAQALAAWACERGVRFAVVHFRGCSGEINRAPRAYHSGDYAEIDWILRRCAQVHAGPVLALGVSLGGNALLRWAQEAGTQAARSLVALAAVSAPLDLAACGEAMGRGFNRQVYTRWFLRTMKPRALRKLDQYPGLFDREALLQARSLYDFDNAFTAPLHGFQNTRDYWHRASARHHLAQIAVPALVLNARNDPFVPVHCLPRPDDEVGHHVTVWQPEQGGHVGFVQGAFPGHLRAMPEAVGEWLLAHTQALSK